MIQQNPVWGQRDPSFPMTFCPILSKTLHLGQKRFPAPLCGVITSITDAIVIELEASNRIRSRMSYDSNACETLGLLYFDYADHLGISDKAPQSATARRKNYIYLVHSIWNWHFGCRIAMGSHWTWQSLYSCLVFFSAIRLSHPMQTKVIFFFFFFFSHPKPLFSKFPNSKSITFPKFFF